MLNRHGPARDKRQGSGQEIVESEFKESKVLLGTMGGVTRERLEKN